MDKLSKAELEAIVRRQLPSFRVVDEAPIEDDGPAPFQMRSPGLEAIKEKLRGSIEPYFTRGAGVETAEAGDQDVVQTVRVQPKGANVPQEPKTVLISAARKSIIGHQG